MVHLNQCTKAHVLKIVGELNETRCRVFELKSSGDVAAGKESESWPYGQCITAQTYNIKIGRSETI
jgi:hypothetical protein